MTTVPRASTRSMAAFSERPAGGFEDEGEAALGVTDRGYETGGAKPVEHPGALGAADDCGDPRPGTDGELHGQVADPAGRAGDQHALAQ